MLQTACGRAHTIAVSEDGRLYVWGDNYEGALGTGGKTDQVHIHIHTSAHTHKWDTYKHTQTHVWGYDYEGAPGTGGKTDELLI
jgi:alpha-tubulin suppressor-like RCC1 family protein